MDRGILRREPTRRAAVQWILTTHLGGVIERHSSWPGVYEYVLGIRGEDWRDSFFVQRHDTLADDGWDVDQIPLYPFPDDPFTEV